MKQSAASDATSRSFRDQVTNLLSGLPANLDWFVAFDLAALREVADEAVLRAAWYLPADAVLPRDGAAVLTSAGTAVVGRGAVEPSYWDGACPWPRIETDEANLLSNYEHHLTVLGGEEPLCIGVGRASGGPPVALLVESGPGGGSRARAAFDRPPTVRDYELLAGCGVRFEGVHQVGEFHVARFLNRLSAHMTAALGSAFVRTPHCNLFFFRGGELDADLVDGLIRAGEARLQVGIAMVRATVVSLALAARRIPMPMTAVPPPPASPSPMGDLVPLGLLLHALRATGAGVPSMEAAAQLLDRHLDTRRQDGLWPFQTGRLITATDSALILLGRRDRTAIERLERFSDGQGGYLPQLTSATEKPGHMLDGSETRHWTCPDLGTGLVVRMLRQDASMTETVPLAAIERAFETRSALFFANPFLLDWLLAETLARDPAGERLRLRLADEVGAAVNDDMGFGRWDPGLSTACAVLALAACGRRGRLMRLAQLRLLDLVDATGQAEPSCPFYSTLSVELEDDGPFGVVPDRPAILRVNGERHALTLYEDSFRMIGTALRLRALSEPCDPRVNDLPDMVTRAARHRRYQCPDIHAYLREVALPPYLELAAVKASASP